MRQISGDKRATTHPKVTVTAVRHHSNDLVMSPKGRDEIGNVLAVAEVLHQLELVEDPRRRARHIDPLEGHINAFLSPPIY